MVRPLVLRLFRQSSDKVKIESYCLKNEDSTEATGEYRKLVFDKEGEKMGRKHGLELVLDYGNR